ncbi:MAG: hypothetical protein ABR599_12780 [Gemmatimonadota bacterium]
MDAEESPAGSGWSRMGGAGDEHIGAGKGSWDEDWSASEEGEDSEKGDLYEGRKRSEAEDE